MSYHLRKNFKRFFSDYCTFKTFLKNKENFQENNLPWDPKIDHCENCGKYFSVRRSLLKHSKICGINDIKILKPYSCDHCDYRSRDKSTIRIHIHRKHFSRDSLVNCRKCGKIFLSETSLKSHFKFCSLPEKEKLFLPRL